MTRRSLHLAVTLTSVSGIMFAAADEQNYLSNARQKYTDFKKRYSLVFPNMEEDEYRYSVFKKNLALIGENNKKNLPYTLEVNKYTAMTDEEFAAGQQLSLSGYDEGNASWKIWSNLSQASHEGVQDPTDFSWVDKGAVNTPMDQGKLGCCYAFAGLGALEGAFMIKTGALPRMAPQQIVDCSTDRPTTFSVMLYVKYNGIVSDADYPYEAKVGKCQKDIVEDKTKQCLQPYDFDPMASVFIKPYDLKGLFSELQKGPIAVSVNASTSQWKQYKGGILEGFDCGQRTNHAILLVGYGVENGKSYWQLKNSWGTDWGEGGYVRIIRDPDAEKGPGFCNILSGPAIRPVLANEIKATACRSSDH